MSKARLELSRHSEHREKGLVTSAPLPKFYTETAKGHKAKVTGKTSPGTGHLKHIVLASFACGSNELLIALDVVFCDIL